MEASKTGAINKNLVPPEAEVKGSAVLVDLSDLKVAMTVSTASKEITSIVNILPNPIPLGRTKRGRFDLHIVGFLALKNTTLMADSGPRSYMRDEGTHSVAFWTMIPMHPGQSFRLVPDIL